MVLNAKHLFALLCLPTSQILALVMVFAQMPTLVHARVDSWEPIVKLPFAKAFPVPTTPYAQARANAPAKILAFAKRAILVPIVNPILATIFCTITWQCVPIKMDHALLPALAIALLDTWAAIVKFHFASPFQALVHRYAPVEASASRTMCANVIKAMLVRNAKHPFATPIWRHLHWFATIEMVHACKKMFARVMPIIWARNVKLPCALVFLQLQPMLAPERADALVQIAVNATMATLAPIVNPTPAIPSLQ